jgi:sRNA-binding protein
MCLRHRSFWSKSRATYNPDVSVPERLALLVHCRAHVYFKRKTEAEKKAKRRAAHERWCAKNREILAQKKREWARRPETLARRRELYRIRKDPKPTPVTEILTLDAWAKSLT